MDALGYIFPCLKGPLLARDVGYRFRSEEWCGRVHRFFSVLLKRRPSALVRSKPADACSGVARVLPLIFWRPRGARSAGIPGFSFRLRNQNRNFASSGGAAADEIKGLGVFCQGINDRGGPDFFGFLSPHKIGEFGGTGEKDCPRLLSQAKPLKRLSHWLLVQ